MDSTLTIHVNLTMEEEERLIRLVRERAVFDEFTFKGLRLRVMGDVTLAQECSGLPLRLTMKAIRVL